MDQSYTIPTGYDPSCFCKYIHSQPSVGFSLNRTRRTYSDPQRSTFRPTTAHNQTTMSITTKDNTRQIELLKRDNFSSWFVNIRAELRTKKLWKYIQEVYKSESEDAATTEESQPERTLSRREERAIKEWEDKCQEAADLMTPTISPGIQLILSEAEFNNDFLMLTKLRIELQPGGNSEFMRLSKEYYTLQFKSFKSIPEYLTRIKVLEEKIDSTKVVLDTNNRTILCLSMSLPQEYQYLIQIWATMPTPITADRARQMVLEASRQYHQALHNSHDPGLAMRAEGQRDKCKHCGSTRHSAEKCWQEYPEQAPPWFKEKMEADSKEDGKAGKQARKFQAKLAKKRGDDFIDSGTHFSA